MRPFASLMGSGLVVATPFSPVVMVATFSPVAEPERTSKVMPSILLRVPPSTSSTFLMESLLLSTLVKVAEAVVV